MKQAIRGTQRQSRAITSGPHQRCNQWSSAYSDGSTAQSAASLMGDAINGHQRSSAVISLLGRVDSPERSLSGALALSMRVVFRIAELEGEVDRDGLILRQLVPLHALPSTCAISGHQRCNQRSIRGQSEVSQRSVRAHQGYAASVHLHVLIEPRVPSREWPNGQSPIRERDHLTPLPR